MKKIILMVSIMFCFMLGITNIDSHAYDMEDLFEDECIEYGYPPFTSEQKAFLNRGFQYDFMIFGQIDGYMYKTPGIIYHTANGPLEFEYVAPYQRFKNNTLETISIYSMTMKTDGTYTTSSMSIIPGGQMVIYNNSLVRTAYPYQGNLPAMNTNVTQSDFLMQPDTIPQSGEFVYITLPPDNWQTVDKYISYNIVYSINGASPNDIIIGVEDQDGVNFGENTNIKSWKVQSHTSQIVDGKVQGHMKLEVWYHNIYTGPAGITLEILNQVTNRQLVGEKNITIRAFTDADGDGIDDNTDETPYVPPRDPTDFEDGRPNRDDYSNDIWGEIQYGFDTLVYFITLPFKYLGESLTFVTTWLGNSMGWISSMSSVFTSIFSFLPPEITGGMIFLFMIFVVFAIIKMIRG